MISSLLLMTFAENIFKNADWQGRFDHSSLKAQRYAAQAKERAAEAEHLQKLSEKWQSQNQIAGSRLAEIRHAEEIMMNIKEKIAEYNRIQEENKAELERLHRHKEELMKVALRDPQTSAAEKAVVIEEVRQEGPLADPDLVNAAEVAAEQTLTHEAATEAAPAGVYHTHAEIMPQEQTATVSANMSAPEVMPVTETTNTPAEALTVANTQTNTDANAL